MRQAGVQAETSSWGFLVSAYISKRRRGSLLQRPTAVQGLNPTKHELLTHTPPDPPTPKKSGTQVGGGGGRGLKIEKFGGGSFCVAK